MRKIVILPVITVLIVLLGCSGSSDNVSGSDSTGISISDGSATEGEAIRFIVTLSRLDTENIVYSFATSNGSAQAGSDYLGITGTDTIKAGSTADTIDVTTIDDALIENTETFSIGLATVINASITDGTGTGSIRDNDGGGVSVLYSANIRPILLNRCALSGCHGTGSSSGGYSMGNATYSEVRMATGDHGAIISAGNAAASNLYLKTTTNPPFPVRMPLGRTPLSIADQETIRDWINEGALDN